MRRPPIHERAPFLAEQYIQERKQQPGFGDLEYLGSGGGQVVFGVIEKSGDKEGLRQLVLKADFRYLKHGILREIRSRQAHLNHDLQRRTEDAEAISAIEREEKEEMHHTVERERAYYVGLRECFPKETIIATRIYIRDVPVTRTIIMEALQDTDLEEIDIAQGEMIEIPTIVRYQTIIPEEVMTRDEKGTNPEVYSTGFHYVERTPIFEDEYARLNQMIQTDQEPFDYNLFQRFLHPDLRGLLSKSRIDPELKSTLQDFVQRAIRFTKRTQEMIDIAGPGNVRVYKNKDGKWSYLIVDPFSRNKWSDGTIALRHMLAGQPSVEIERMGSLLNALNYERTINGLAHILGVEDRLSLLGSEEEDNERAKFMRGVLRDFQSHYGRPWLQGSRRQLPGSDATIEQGPKKFS